MSEIEFNKIFAAILIAGITFMLSGFLAGKIIHEDELEQPAYPIEGVELDGAAVVEKKIELPDPVLELIATADVGLGEKLSRQCAACHSFDKDGPNKIGPNLWDIMNRPLGAANGFSYSSALIDHGGAWGYESMNKFLWRPDWYIPGTKMNYIGIKKPEKRAAMIAWLRTLSDNTQFPLPTQAEIDAEKAELLPPEEPADEAATENKSEGAKEAAVKIPEKTTSEEASPSTDDASADETSDEQG